MESKNRNALLLSVLVLFFSINLFSQKSILDEYVRYGLKENTALKKKQLSYEESLAALKEAKGLWYPQLSLNARYSVAQGGRVIELPIGDLLNPVYNTLNELTQASPEPFSAMLVDNEEIQFLRPAEHETKLRLTQAVYNPQIGYNKRIKKELIGITKADENAYTQELVFEIKSAYYNYLKTISVLKLLEETESLVDENIRVNEKLLQNDKITLDVLYRAKAEKAEVEHLLAIAEMNNRLATSHFNFLLNKPFKTEILIDSTIYEYHKIYDLESSKLQSINNRYELDMINYYKSVSNLNLKLNKAYKLPSISAVVDYGYQGEEYSFDGESDFVMAAAVLQWDLFKGFQNDAKIQQAKIQQQQTELQYQETQNLIMLEVENAYYVLESAYKAVDAAESENNAMQKAFKLILKKYQNEQANLLEYIDARNSLTTSSEKLIIAKYEALTRMAEFEKVVGLYQINE